MNIAAVVIDFSRVLIFARDDVPSLNRHHEKLQEQSGYRVLEHFHLNTELLDYLRGLSQRVPIFLFTNGRLHSLPEIAPSLEGIFREIINSDSLGFSKTESEAYLTLSYRIGFAPAQILYIDDAQANIDAAAAAGLTAVRYTGNAGLIAILDQGRA